ncbi:MAG: hypothetical protein IPF99_03745 [Deltaproteobacteria bacterium]|nr:hypothetical protein [Deltaproteobacteria bacterium]
MIPVVLIVLDGAGAMTTTPCSSATRCAALSEKTASAESLVPWKSSSSGGDASTERGR